MKKKNRLLLILALCLTALFAVSLVACNPSGTNTPGSNNPNNYEVAKYTVTFNTNSSFVLANPVVRDIPYGDRVQEPADSNGNKIKPYKEGYTFLYWSSDGTNPFDFTQGITKNTTLTALYSNNKYYHTPVLRAKLEYDGEKFTVNESARGENDVSLPAAELDKNTTSLYSTYATANDKFPCPTAVTTPDGSENKFCFWYYINAEGKPVQLSKWKADNESTVTALASYYFTGEQDKDGRFKGLTIYPMFSDNLPKVTVKYLDSLDKDGDTLFPNEEYTFGKNIEYTDENMPKPTKSGYKFEYWYYVVENKDNNGEITYEDKTFVFAKEGEKNPTSPMDASGAEDNFSPAVLKLYAKWTKEIKIASAQEYKTFYDEFKALTSKKDPTEEDLAKIEETLTANIVFSGTLNFADLGDVVLEPLFDSAHPFRGTIDGAVVTTANPETTVADTSATTKAKFVGGKFGDATSASVFGYNQGTIRNIEFSNIGLNVTDAQSTRVYLGVITTDNAGSIEDCVVTMDILTFSNLHSVIFGGVTALNHGITTRNGVIRNCTVNILNANFTCEALTFGGIAGESDASASLVLDTVNISVSSLKCQDDGVPANGRSSLIVGGLVGINASHIRLCRVEAFTVTTAESLTEFVFGGVTGVNSGNINTTYANVTLGASDAPVSASGSISLATAIGGLIGKNQGYALNSYVNANLYVAVKEASQNTNLFIGGLIGSNYSDKQDSSSADTGICAINYCYSLGEIQVEVAEGIECVNVYAGGIAGRNSHKKSMSLFTKVNISIVNDGENNVGFTYGKMLNNVGTNGRIFFGNDNTIKVRKNGGDWFTLDGKDATVEDSAFKKQCNFTNIGDMTDPNNFKNSDWVVGAPSVESTLKFGSDWEVKADSYPSFKDSIYNDRADSDSKDAE